MSGNKRILSEDQKNELVTKYKGLVYYFANRYRFFDSDIEEVRGWGFLGLAKAINRYENDISVCIDKIIYTGIRTEILSQYTKNRKPKSESSMQKMLSAGGLGDLTLGDLIADDSTQFHENDLREIIQEALVVESERFRAIAMDYYFTQKDIKQIAEENKITQAMVTRTHRRGQALIKRHLINNGIILDYSLTPDNEKGSRILKHEPALSKYFGEIKYIRRHYTFLNENDIAFLVGVSSYAISKLLDYPSTKYLNTRFDDSIKEKVIKYCNENYPGRLPSKVITIPFKDL